MKTFKTSGILLMASVMLFSCKKDEIRGTGNITTEQRSLPAFSNVTIQGPIKVRVHYGTNQLVTVKTDAIAMSKVSTFVSNNTLMIDLDESYNYQHISFVVDVTIPVIHRLTQAGVSDSELSGFQGLGVLDVVHDGVGDLALSGSATTLNITHDGVGDLNAFGFNVDTCHMGHSGVGNVEVSVDQLLEGWLSGVGSIYYQGSPSVNINDTGVGSVIQIN